ncbi:hypothetical protein F383_27435 [Gossypium arboreum]|uniref:Uncharacterized protein n=1 Tax=Gossypium arboreum TaxID=29729 RepID=A0A0B0PA79_GOSAR|nr:hypothetical protein F383_27435 [Gossypium arboreum]
MSKNKNKHKFVTIWYRYVLEAYELLIREMMISRYVVMEVNYDLEIMVNYVTLCYITWMINVW